MGKLFKSKKIFLFLFCFLFIFFYCYSQDSSNSSSVDNSENTFSLSAPESESSLSFNDSEENIQQSSSKVKSFFLFLRMIIVLIIVVACIYGVMWFMKKSIKTNPNNTDPFLRRVSTVDISVGKSVQVVTLLDHAYIIGVSDNSINLIDEVKDKELINAMNLYADEHQNVKKPQSFSDVLDIFMPNGPKDKSGVFSESQTKISELLKKQRNRINKEE